MGFVNPSTSAPAQFEAPKCITAPLVQTIVNQDLAFNTDHAISNDAIHAVKKMRNEKLKEDAEKIYSLLPPPTPRLVDCACEKGASSWMSTLPMEEHGFV